MHGTHGILRRSKVLPELSAWRLCVESWGDTTFPSLPNILTCSSEASPEFLRPFKIGGKWTSLKHCRWPQVNSRYDFCQDIMSSFCFCCFICDSDFMIRSYQWTSKAFESIDTWRAGKIHHSPAIFFFPLNSRKAWMLEITASSARDFIGIMGRNNNHSCNLRGVRLIAAL